MTKDGKFLRTIQAAKNSEGVVIGELAILYNCKRTASITAVSDCKVWYLDRDSFQAIAIETGQLKLNEYKSFLKQVGIFKSFPERKLAKLVDALETVRFRQGEFIIKQNSHGDTFYIVSEGQVDVTQDVHAKDGGTNTETIFIRTMKRGDYFGEKALLENHALRTANVVAKSGSVTCLCLEREDFVRLIGVVASRKYGNEDGESNRLSISSTGSPSCLSDDDKRMSIASFIRK